MRKVDFLFIGKFKQGVGIGRCSEFPPSINRVGLLGGLVLEVPDVSARGNSERQHVNRKTGLEPMNEVFVDVGVFFGRGLNLIESRIQFG